MSLLLKKQKKAISGKRMAIFLFTLMAMAPAFADASFTDKLTLSGQPPGKGANQKLWKESEHRGKAKRTYYILGDGLSPKATGYHMNPEGELEALKIKKSNKLV